MLDTTTRNIDVSDLLRRFSRARDNAARRRAAISEMARKAGVAASEGPISDDMDAKLGEIANESALLRWRLSEIEHLSIMDAILERLPIVGKRRRAVRSAAVRSVKHKLDKLKERRKRREATLRKQAGYEAYVAMLDDRRSEFDLAGAAMAHFSDLMQRLERLAAAEVVELVVPASIVPFSNDWLKAVTLQLQVAELRLPGVKGSVVSAGIDTSSLDLSARSKALPMLRAAPSFEQSPWLRQQPDRRQVIAEENRLPGSLAGFRLLGPSVVDASRLFAPRERQGVPLLPGVRHTANHITLPIADADVPDAIQAGAVMSRRSRVSIDPTAVDCGGPAARFLPFIAQRFYAPLAAETVPSSSWGASLSGLLTNASWNAIRLPVIERFGGICQICGQPKDGQSPECHEIWDYRSDLQVDGRCVQKLVGLLCVCKACHGAFHQGFSAMRGRSDEAAYRLADINGWTMTEMEDAEEWMRHNYEKRSSKRWALDLSLIDKGQPIFVNKRLWALTDGGSLVRVGMDDSRTPSTRILGVGFRIGTRGEIQRNEAPMA